MKKTLKFLFFSFALLSIVGWSPFSFFTSSNDEPPESQAWIEQEIKLLNSQADNLDLRVLKLSLSAYQKGLRMGLNNKPILTIIDYSKPSTERRLWVLDLKRNRVLFNTHVSHGKNSGTNMPTSFSNELGSLKSSLGLFLTKTSYFGSNGYSLRLVGLEPGVNHNAYRRAIVIHGAWYADGNIVKKYGELGRSWGCPAVSDRIARPLIDTIKGDTLVFVYSNNDRRWLNKSTFLAG